MNLSRAGMSRWDSGLHWLILCVALALISPLQAKAQGSLAALTGGTATDSAAALPDPYGRESPRSLVVGLVAAFASGDAERAAHFLQTNENAAADTMPTLAQGLQKRLDSSGSLLPFAALSNEPAGATDDGLPLDVERIGTFRAISGEVPLLAKRLAPGGALPYWVVSTESLIAIADEAPEVARVAATKLLPNTLNETRVAGAPVADWLIVVSLALFAFIGMRMVFYVILKLFHALVRQPELHRGYQFAEAAFPPLGMYLAVIILFFGTQQLQVAIVARQVLARYAGIVGWVAFVWFLWNLIDMVSDLWSARMLHGNRRRALSALVFARRSAKAVLAVAAFVAVLDTIGFDVTTGIAALGLGGLAIALGAQKTIENLVGSLAVIMDQPVRVGDFCKVGEVTGTVEDIGMRSTQLRTNARTVVTIPNGDFSSKQIENYSRRDRFLFNPTIGLVYDTSPQKMRVVLTALRTLLDSDVQVSPGARVRFVNFSASSLDIEIFSYIATHDYAEFLAIREEILLKIMDAVENASASMAYPTQTIVMKDSP